MSFEILGTGSAHPACRKTNDDIAQLVDTSDEWIRSRTGIESRYVCTTETLQDLALEAAQKALKMAKVQPKELDLILIATIRGDCITPSAACILQNALGASCPAFDLNAACSGFLYALDTADGWFCRNRAKKVLVVAAETMSRLLNYQDRTTCPLFGDGAGAVVLGQGDALLSIHLTAKGDPLTLRIDNTDGQSPFLKMDHPAEQYLHMSGQNTYRFAVSNLCRQLKLAAQEAGIDLKDLDWVLPHQANLRIIEGAQHRLPIPTEKYCINIQNWGNTSAAAVPILMDEFCRKGTFEPGDLLGLVVFGGGLTTGSAILRWTIDPKKIFDSEVSK